METMGLTAEHVSQRDDLCSILHVDFGEFSLPLCVSFRHVSWMTPMRAEDGLRIPAARDGFGRIAPRSLMEAPTANRDQ
jgi:hypothetical protein